MHSAYHLGEIRQMMCRLRVLKSMRQVTVYREPGRFAGWPANYGIWCWGDEIVVGFTSARIKRPSAGMRVTKTSHSSICRRAASIAAQLGASSHSRGICPLGGDFPHT